MQTNRYKHCRRRCNTVYIDYVDF